MFSTFCVLLVCAQLHFLFSIFTVGLALQSWLNRIWSSTALTQPSYSALLVPVALGIYWNTTQFYIFYNTGLTSSKYILILKYLLDILILAASLALNHLLVCNILRQVKAVTTRRSTYCLGIVALSIGLASFYYFPYAFDNAQLSWTQYLIKPQISFWASNNYGQIGYSSLIYYIGYLFDFIPLTTVSSAFKPALFVLILLCCFYIFEQIRYKPLWTFSALYFFILFFSAFGQWGAFVTGKPSIYGVILSMVFFASFLKPFKEIKFNEVYLYFSVAAFSGIITIPYMAMFSLFIFFTSAEKNILTRKFRNLIVVAFFPLFVAASYATSLSTISVAIGLLASLLIVSLLTKLDFNSHRNHRIFNNSFLRRGTAFLPLIGIAASYFLMPATLIPNGRSPFPLDGTTTLLEYLLYQDKKIAPAIIVLGVISAILLPFIVSRKDKFGIQAFCIWPIATIVFVLVVVHLNIPLPLHPSIFWNVIKDVVQWYGGPLFGLLVLLLILESFILFKERLKKSKLLPPNKENAFVQFVGIFLLTTILLGHIGYFQRTLAYQPPTFTSIGGHGDPDLAILAEQIWSQPGVKTFVMTNNSNYFYPNGIIRHYGSTPERFDQEDMDKWLKKLEGEQQFWMIVNVPYVATFFEWLDRQKGSSEYVMPLDHNSHHLFFVELDQRGESTPPPFVERSYQLGTRIDFSSKGNGWIYNSLGWIEPGSQATWTNGEEASLTMTLNHSQPLGDLSLSAITKAYVNERQPELKVDVIANGEPVGQWKFVHGQSLDNERGAIIPADLVNQQNSLQITFRIPNAKSPAELGLHGDTRKLGLALVSMKLTPAVCSSYTLGETIAFGQEGNSESCLGQGWSKPGSWGTWTEGNEALLKITLADLEPPGDVLLSVKARAFVHEVHPELDVDVIVNDEQVGEWEFVHGQADSGVRTAILPASLVNKQKPLQIAFRVPNAKSLAELGLASDERQFGLGLLELRLSKIEGLE
jgi:hypothetical protein